MMIWGLILLFAAILGALPFVFGLLGIVASSVIWIGFFVTVSTAMTRKKMRIFRNWDPLHLAAIVLMPAFMLAGIYLFPGVLEI